MHRPFWLQPVFFYLERQLESAGGATVPCLLQGRFAGAWLCISSGSQIRDLGRQLGTRTYGAVRFDTMAQPISILPQGDRKFSILPSQFSIQPQDGGQSLAALR